MLFSRREVLEHLTNLGDAAVSLPASLVVCFALCLIGAQRMAFFWALAIASGIGLMFAAKFACIACYPNHLFDSLLSPSGHAEMSAAFYGPLAVIASSVHPVWGARAIQAICATLIAFIAVSRVELGAHSDAATLVGLAIEAKLESGV